MNHKYLEELQHQTVHMHAESRKSQKNRHKQSDPADPVRFQTHQPRQCLESARWHMIDQYKLKHVSGRAPDFRKTKLSRLGCALALKRLAAATACVLLRQDRRVRLALLAFHACGCDFHARVIPQLKKICSYDGIMRLPPHHSQASGT